MKVLYFSYGKGPEDKRAWSGTVYKVYKALLATGADVDFLTCASVQFPFLVRMINGLLFRLRKKVQFKYHFLPNFTRLYRQNLYRFLRNKPLEGYDFFFLLDTEIMSALIKVVKEKGINTKMILLADTPYIGMEGYYPEYTNVLSFNSRYAHHLSHEVWNACDEGIFSSQWAKDNAVNGYGINPNKLHVIEFGANIDTPVLGTRTISFKDKTSYNILLSGVDWVRKGGEVAVECCEQLVRMRGKFTLHIVGMPVPEQYKALPFIKEYGFLNKNIPEQYAKYLAILEQMDIFLFPSRAECSATVLCEAAGLGLPTFCFETGGLANYVVNGKNGERLPLSASGADFAEAIMNAIETDKLDDYSRGAQEMYNTRLNWNTWTQRVKKEILV